MSDDTVSQFMYFIKYYRDRLGNYPLLEQVEMIARGRSKSFHIGDPSALPTDLQRIMSTDPHYATAIESAVRRIVAQTNQRLAEDLQGMIEVVVESPSSRALAAADNGELAAELARRLDSGEMSLGYILEELVARHAQKDAGRIVTVGLVVPDEEYAVVSDYCAAQLDDYFRKTGHRRPQSGMDFDGAPSKALMRRVYPILEEQWKQIYYYAKDTYRSRVSGMLKRSDRPKEPLLAIPDIHSGEADVDESAGRVADAGVMEESAEDHGNVEREE